MFEETNIEWVAEKRLDDLSKKIVAIEDGFDDPDLDEEMIFIMLQSSFQEYDMIAEYLKKKDNNRWIEYCRKGGFSEDHIASDTLA